MNSGISLLWPVRDEDSPLLAFRCEYAPELPGVDDRDGWPLGSLM